MTMRSPWKSASCSAAALLILLVLLLAPRNVHAQEPLMPGSQIRVIGAGTSLRGVLHSMDEDSIRVLLHIATPPVAVSLGSVYEVRMVEPRGRLAGAGRGLAIGAAVGVPLFLLDCWSDMDACRMEYELPEDATSGQALTQAVYVGVVGAGAIGAVVGAMWPGRREVPVLVRSRVILEADAAGGRTRLGLRVPTGGTGRVSR
jgi:hypothetical protein